MIGRHVSARDLSLLASKLAHLLFLVAFIFLVVISAARKVANAFGLSIIIVLVLIQNNWLLYNDVTFRQRDLLSMQTPHALCLWRMSIRLLDLVPKPKTSL